MRRFLRVSFPLVMVIALIVLASEQPKRTQAQATWFAYLFNNSNKALVRVNLDGSQEAFDLGLGDNAFFSPWDSAFSADGRLVAFCIVDFAPETQGATHFYLRDIAAEENLLDIDLGTTIGCALSPDAMNADATQVALSVVNYYPGDAETQTDPNEPIWQLFVFDTATGEVVNELNANSSLLEGLEMTLGMPALPRVRLFAGNQIIFLDVPYGIGGSPAFPSYIWSLDANTVAPIANWQSPFLGTLGDELVWIDVDPDLPAGVPGGPIPGFNVVKYTDSSGDVRMIYHDPAWILTNAEFIDNGRQVAVQLLAPYDPESVELQSTRWIALDRSGAVTELPSGGTYSEIASAPDGFVLLGLDFAEDFSNPHTTLTYFMGESETVLWEDASDGWSLAWSLATAADEGLQAFPVVAP